MGTRFIIVAALLLAFLAAVYFWYTSPLPPPVPTETQEPAPQPPPTALPRKQQIINHLTAEAAPPSSQPEAIFEPLETAEAAPDEAVVRVMDMLPGRNGE